MRTLPALATLVTLAAALLGPAADAEPERPAGRCWIDGVVRHAGAPVAARVELYLWAPNPRFPHGFYWSGGATLADLVPPPGPARVAATQASSDGTFAFRTLRPGKYLVRATGSSGAWGGALVPLDVDGQHHAVGIRLHGTSESLAGRFTHADGRPFRGQVVAGLEPPFWNPSPLPCAANLRTATPDAQGRFRIEALPPGKVWVTAFEPGTYRRTVGVVDLPQERELVFVVDGVKRLKTGRVLDVATDEPIAGAQVVWEAYWTPAGTCYGTTQTDPQGRFRLAAPRGVDRLHIGKPGYCERFEDKVGPLEGRTFRLRRGTSIRGEVVRADTGAPVAGLPIERRGPGSYWYQWTHTLTDEHGRFELRDQAPGWGFLFARGGPWIPEALAARRPFASFDDFVFVHPLKWHLAPGRDARVRLAVVRGASLTGRVVDHEGRPVAGVPIIDEEHEDPAFSWTGQEPPPMAASGPDGRFRVDGLVPGEAYELLARPTIGAPVKQKLRLSADPTRVDDVELRLPAPHWLLVKVVDSETGKAITGAQVSLMLRSRDERVWRSGPDGVAKVGPIGPLKGTLDVTAPGYIDANQRSAARATPEGASVTVPLERAREIRGRVTMEDGAPAGDAIVYAANVGHRVIDWDHYRGKERCRADGAFTLRSVKAIEYALRAVLWRDGVRFEATTRAVGGAGDVRLTLVPRKEPDPAHEEAKGPGSEPEEERPPALVVLVKDPQGRPVPLATFGSGPAQLIFPRGIVRNGRLELDEPLAPLHVVEVWGACAEDGIALPLGPLRIENTPASHGTMTLTLPPERSIRGRVTFEDGAPVPRVWIEAFPVRLGVTPPPSEHRDAARSGAATDADGRFRLGGLGDETYALRMTAPQGVVLPRRYPRATPGEKPVAIRARRARTVGIAVVDPDGRPVQGAEVSATRTAWHYFWRRGWERRALVVGRATTDADGRCTVAGVDPGGGDWMHVALPPGQEDLAAGPAQPAAADTMRFTLAPKGRIKGRIVDATGKAIGDEGHVLWRQGGSWQREFVWIGEDGFELELEAVGEVELAAVAGHARQPLPTTRIVRTSVGADGVVLVQDPGAEIAIRFEGWERGGDEFAFFEAFIRREDVPHAPWSGLLDRAPPNTLRGLDARGTYTIWVAGTSGHKCARVTGLRPDVPAVIKLEPGVEIRGRWEVEDDHAMLAIEARPPGGGPRVQAELTPGEYVLRGLTPGPWRVTATAVVDEAEVRAEVVVEAGGTADLTLR